MIKYSHKELDEKFSGKFVEMRAKIFRTPKNVPASSPMLATPSVGFDFREVTQGMEMQLGHWRLTPLQNTAGPLTTKTFQRFCLQTMLRL